MEPTVIVNIPYEHLITCCKKLHSLEYYFRLVMEAIVKVGIFLAGAIWYAVAVGGFKRWATWLYWGFIAVSVLASAVPGDTVSPTSANTVAISALIFYVVATLIIYFVEKNERRP